MEITQRKDGYAIRENIVKLNNDLVEEDMNEYIKGIEEIAARCTMSQSDGYSQIMRICEAMKEKQQYCLGYQSENGIKSHQFD